MVTTGKAQHLGLAVLAARLLRSGLGLKFSRKDLTLIKKVVNKIYYYKFANQRIMKVSIGLTMKRIRYKIWAKLQNTGSLI